MKFNLLTMIITSFLLVSCNYRLFDLIQYPELSGHSPNNKGQGDNVTEENFTSINQTVIQPKCSACHKRGGRAGSIVLDNYEIIVGATGRRPLVVPGKPDQSLFYTIMLESAGRRIMPPKSSGLLPVDSGRLQLIRAWIADGAPKS